MSSRFYKDGFTKVIATTKICKSTAVGFLSSFRKAVECYFCDFLVGMITFIKKNHKIKLKLKSRKDSWGLHFQACVTLTPSHSDNGSGNLKCQSQAGRQRVLWWVGFSNVDRRCRRRRASGIDNTISVNQMHKPHPRS
jgi:hypothetical protein